MLEILEHIPEAKTIDFHRRGIQNHVFEGA
jgi:hypothetical protein